MDTNALKSFAQAARNLLIDQVTSKLDLVLAEGAPARREHPQAVKDLENAIRKTDRQQVIEQVAYTWFNRFTALRFMDANGYTQVRVVSPADEATRPEILTEALAGNIPEDAPGEIAALLEGRTPSNAPQAEAYRLLLVHACNQWHKPMPFLFEELDDYTELLMPEDLLSQSSILAELRNVMTEDACQDVEIIGWLYQFYISEKKDEVFAGLKKNVKITAENIPAATQLFTPHWIVRYLVENSLGRLWLLNNPQSGLAAKMDYYIAPEEPETDFLRITKPEEIRICDPAAGSGHMLTYAFDLLYAIYEEEGYDATEIPALILTHNLTGVEIDDRAGALAAFALAMKAAGKLGRRRFLRMEAKPDICVLQNVAFTEAEMQDVAAVVGKDLFTDELRETLGQFEQAKNFGSLIVPKLRDPAETLRVVEARDFGGDLLLKEVQERVIAVLRMAEALSPKYHVVVANPPYMGSANMTPTLKSWVEKHYPRTKQDLMTAFMERAAGILNENGYWGMINLPAWLFLDAYSKMRQHMLRTQSFASLIHLGRGIFGADFGSTAFVLKNAPSTPEILPTFFRTYTNHVDVRTPEKIEEIFRTKSCDIFRLPQSEMLSIPGSPVAYWVNDAVRRAFRDGRTLSNDFDLKTGIIAGDNEQFIRSWPEVELRKMSPVKRKADKSRKWFPLYKGGERRKWYGNLADVIEYSGNGSTLMATKKAMLRNKGYYFEAGIHWNRLSNEYFGARISEEGCIFEDLSPSLFGDDAEAIALPLLNSKTTRYFIRMFSSGRKTEIGHVGSVPTPVRYASSEVEKNSSRLVCLGRSDWDGSETSMTFTTLPLLSDGHRGETLADSYATLRAHWQSMTDEMRELEEENNRIFIDAYGLQDELTPEVPIEEITLTCNPAYRYGVKGTEGDRETRLRADTMAEFLSYAVGCMFGRYSLDAPGLILANQGERLEDYLARVPEPSFLPDEDNVIPVLDENWFPDDITERFRVFLRTTFGEQHFRENLKFIEDSLGKDIRKYFTKDFYADHVKRYKKRPIYWMVSSPKGTFNALIYMHRYRGDTVSVLLNDYLREFITKLEGERTRLEKLADDPTATQGQKTKALKDVAKVAKQIDELNEWERDVIFPLAQQKIEIDLDDGVKANYPKFGAALKKIPGLS